MSRCDTIKTIAFFVIVVLIGVLMAICLIQYGNSINIPDENTPQLTPNSSVQRTPGLLIISHREEIIPENGTLVVKKMEQLAEDNLQNLLATIDTGNIKDCKKYGTVALMQYTTPIDLIWIDQGGYEPISHTIDVQKIIITIPDRNERRFGPKDLEYRVLLYGSGNPEIKVLGLPIHQANELLELIGLVPAETTL